MLRGEGERISREIANYAGLCQASMAAMPSFTNTVRQMPARAAMKI